MTIDERFERIEHYTAGLAGERRKDREEYKALWRDTQPKIDELGAKTLQFQTSSSRGMGMSSLRVQAKTLLATDGHR